MEADVSRGEPVEIMHDRGLEGPGSGEARASCELDAAGGESSASSHASSAEGAAAAPVVDLAESRARIDEIDAHIIDLFQRRMRISRDVAAYKKATGMQVFDKAREDAKVARARELADDEFKDYMAPLFDLLMEMSRSYQDNILAHDTQLARDARVVGRAEFPASARVAVQGVLGAYSHIAATELFNEPEVSFLSTWEDVCDAVESGAAEFGVLPLENSTAGAVDRVYALMRSRGLFIVRAATMRIEHDLLAKPGVSLEDVHEVFSHEQALRQCEGFIAGLPGDAVASVRANTAMAAQAVANSPRRDVAAISSAACARIYGLDVLAHDIQDEGDNYTRFVCVARKPALYGAPTTSSFLIVTPHIAGALHRVLARLATLGINMTKLQSRPIPGREFEFMFYVDVQCVPGDEAFDAMSRQIPTLCEVCRYLGSYEEVSC